MISFIFQINFGNKLYYCTFFLVFTIFLFILSNLYRYRFGISDATKLSTVYTVIPALLWKHHFLLHRYYFLLEIRNVVCGIPLILMGNRFAHYNNILGAMRYSYWLIGKTCVIIFKKTRSSLIKLIQWNLAKVATIATRIAVCFKDTFPFIKILLRRFQL